MSSAAAKERVDHLKRRLLSWDFHPHDLCQDDLMRCVVIVIQEVMKLDGLGDLNIPDRKWRHFVVVVIVRCIVDWTMAVTRRCFVLIVSFLCCLFWPT